MILKFGSNDEMVDLALPPCLSKLAGIATPLAFWRIVAYPSEWAFLRLIQFSEYPIRRYFKSICWLFEGLNADLAVSSEAFKVIFTR